MLLATNLSLVDYFRHLKYKGTMKVHVGVPKVLTGLQFLVLVVRGL